MTRKFTGSEIVVATHNKGKLAEISRMFEGRGITLLSAADCNLESPEETGTTCVQNAELKARYVAKATGKPALADDSGLMVEALDGAPGVYSADWAELGDGKRDFGVAMQKVHKLIGANPNRRAYFTSVLSLCWPDGHCETVEGFVHGTIVNPGRGTKGFGYDPIFVANGYDITFGEMDGDAKNAISHRADAFRKLINKCFH